MKLTFVLGVFISASTFSTSFSAPMQLQDHWRTWFNWLDTDKDGYLTYNDAEIIAASCEYRSPFTSEDCHILSKKRKYVFENNFLMTPDNVPSNEFMATLTDMFDTDQQTFYDKTDSFIRTWLRCLDVNNDLQLSLDEYSMDIKIAGYQADEFFFAHKPDNNLIRLQTAIDAWLEFLLLKDNNNSGTIASVIG